jgi:Cu-Zn family superoxide dismutase
MIMTRLIRYAAPAVLALALCAGCKSDKSDQASNQSTSMASDKGKQQKPMAVAMIRPAGAAATQASMGNVTGTAKFTQTDKQTVQMVVDLKGLAPNSTHGIHVHEKGDLTAPDLTSAGAHYDPAMAKQHGGPDTAKRHAGDAGNLQADAKGSAHLELTLTGVSLTGDNSLVGRSVIVHEKADDLHSNPSGNSGARIAGGVIEKSAGM